MYFVGRDEREILAPGPFQADKCFEGEVPAAAYSCRLLALCDFISILLFYGRLFWHSHHFMSISQLLMLSSSFNT